MATQVQIVNLALSRLGTDIGIADFDNEQSKEASAARLHYDPALEQVLEAAEWNFATKRVELAQLEDDPPVDWDYAYQYPTDCVKLRRLIPQDGERRVGRAIAGGLEVLSPTLLNDSRIPFAVELNADGDGRMILSDEPNAVAVYTARVEDPTFYPGHFVKALSLFLAHEMCMPMRVDDRRRQAIYQEYVATLSMASASSLNEQRTDPEPLPESIRARM